MGKVHGRKKKGGLKGPFNKKGSKANLLAARLTKQGTWSWVKQFCADLIKAMAALPKIDSRPDVVAFKKFEKQIRGTTDKQQKFELLVQGHQLWLPILMEKFATCKSVAALIKHDKKKYGNSARYSKEEADLCMGGSKFSIDSEKIAAWDPEHLAECASAAADAFETAQQGDGRLGTSSLHGMISTASQLKYAKAYFSAHLVRTMARTFGVRLPNSEWLDMGGSLEGLYGMLESKGIGSPRVLNLALSLCAGCPINLDAGELAYYLCMGTSWGPGPPKGPKSVAKYLPLLVAAKRARKSNRKSK